MPTLISQHLRGAAAALVGVALLAPSARAQDALDPAAKRDQDGRFSFTWSDPVPGARPEGGVAGGVPGACGDTTLSQSTDDATIIVNSAACTAGPISGLNGYARSFPIPAGPNFVVNCVDFGVESNTGNDYTVTVNIYTGAIAGPFGSLTLLGSQDVDIPAGTALASFTADFGAAGNSISVPGGSDMIVEVLAPSRLVADGGDGSGLFGIGSNDFGQSAPSYIRAPDCGAPDFVTTAAIGAPNMHLAMRVDGGPMHWTVVTVCNDTGQDAAGLSLTFTGAGGTLYVPPGSIVAPGCPAPAILSNTAVTDTVVVDWGFPCVPDGGEVTLLIRSATGPIGFASGFWTAVGGAPIGSVSASCLTINALNLGLFGFNNPGVWALKVRTRYTGLFAYGLWTKPPGQCWQRWCCLIGPLCCEYRVYLCWFPSPFFRMLEWGVCVPLTKWKKWRVILPNPGGGPWYLQITTIKPPPHEPQLPPGGPPPEKPVLLPNESMLERHEFEVRNSDDNGQTFTPGADFASTFFDVYNELRIEGFDAALPPVVGFPNITQAMAPGYHNAANALQPLIDELDQIIPLDPAPELPQMRIQTEILQLSLTGIGDQLFAGIPVDPQPFQDAAGAMNGLGSLFELLPDPQPRFQTAAEKCFAMADGLNQAAAQVPSGFPTWIEQDAFLAGLVAQFGPNTEMLADASLPHAVIPLQLGLQSWGPEMIGGVPVQVHPLGQPELADHQEHRLTDQGELLLPMLAEPEPLFVHIKPPTHLATSVLVHPGDGQLLPPIPMIGGDANGDNCIDELDLQQVIDDQGTGGEFAPSVSSSDVTYDGRIDQDDIDLVMSNMGECGFSGEDCNANGMDDTIDLSDGTSGDLNNNEIPDECECVADTDGNNAVDIDDVVKVILDFGSNGDGNGDGCNGDVDNNGIVDIDDVVLTILRFGPCGIAG